MNVSLTGWGLCTALGSDPREVVEALRGVAPHAPLSPLPDAAAAVVTGPSLRPWLKRRKDRKLLARPAALALPALGAALGHWAGDRAELGLFVAVGREPPDGGASEDALAAAHRAGRLDTLRLAGAGRDRYPPLLPLKTLPNMALAHASIHLDIGGENGAWAGGLEAGLMALREGMYAVLEGRAPAALVGGADSQVDLGSARDRLRMGHRGPPGEAGSAVLLEPFEGEPSSATLAVLSLSGCGPVRSLSAHHAGLGDCGAADGVLALVLVAAALSPGEEVQLGGIGVRAPELAVGPC